MGIQRIIGKSAVAGFAAAFAVAGSGLAAQTTGGWQPNDDDSLLFQLRVGRYMLEGDARGYRTDHGTCVDLGDIIQTLDLPIRLAARQAGCSRKTRRSLSTVIPIRYKS